MDIHLSIGQNHRFELHDALLIYKGGRQSFITHHTVVPQENAPPALGPAQPLTFNFVDSLLRSLGRGADAEVLPQNVLAKGDQSLVWWTPRRDRQMFYTNAQDTCAHLNGKGGWVFPSSRSKSGHLTTIAKGFQAARGRAGLDKKLVPYSARHTYGTYTMEKSGDAFAVSKSMGHADLKSMEPYQHQELEPLRVAINQRNRQKSLVRFLVRFWKTHRREQPAGTCKCLRDWEKNGGRGRDRTYDQSIKSRMLYQLSYASTWVGKASTREVC